MAWHFKTHLTVCVASQKQNADGMTLSSSFCPFSAPLFPLTPCCPHSACPPQQPEQCQQQRLTVQRLAFALPQLTLPLPQLQPGPAGARAAVQRVLSRLRIHIPGRLPVQVTIPHATRGPQPGKGARPWLQEPLSAWCPVPPGTTEGPWRGDLCHPTGESSGLISHL